MRCHVPAQVQTAERELAERPHDAPLRAPPAPKAQERTQQPRAKVLEQQVWVPRAEDRGRDGEGLAPPEHRAGALAGWEGRGFWGRPPRPTCKGRGQPLSQRARV